MKSIAAAVVSSSVADALHFRTQRGELTLVKAGSSSGQQGRSGSSSASR